jgi:hypothetical protein
VAWQPRKSQKRSHKDSLDDRRLTTLAAESIFSL